MRLIDRAHRWIESERRRRRLDRQSETLRRIQGGHRARVSLRIDDGEPWDADLPFALPKDRSATLKALTDELGDALEWTARVFRDSRISLGEPALVTDLFPEMEDPLDPRGPLRSPRDWPPTASG